MLLSLCQWSMILILRVTVLNKGFDWSLTVKFRFCYYDITNAQNGHSRDYFRDIIYECAQVYNI